MSDLRCAPQRSKSCALPALPAFHAVPCRRLQFCAGRVEPCSGRNQRRSQPAGCRCAGPLHSLASAYNCLTRSFWHTRGQTSVFPTPVFMFAQLVSVRAACLPPTPMWQPGAGLTGTGTQTIACTGGNVVLSVDTARWGSTTFLPNTARVILVGCGQPLVCPPPPSPPLPPSPDPPPPSPPQPPPPSPPR